MEELFERLLASLMEYQKAEVIYNSIDNPMPQVEKHMRENIDKKKYKFQDYLNDYIDKRIELANRK